ncbi:MAG: hypothetical protein PHU21_03190 [Elusimicrobia bacterium]|nr:hypothetical protein [Elusimicrobiota bacterium]
MSWFFFEFTPAHPYWASLLKFLVLGTLGEWLGGVIRTRGDWKPFPPSMLPVKMAIWALLGLLIRWIFASFALLVAAQAAQGLLPEACGRAGSLAFALAVSLQLNLMFSPLLMVLHRALDNVSVRRWNWAGMETALFSIVWFWLPAHTVTFLLPENFRVAFAALLGVALGAILGYANRAAPVKEV